MIVSLSQLRANDVATAGGKGANLGELIAAGFPIPAGFCVTAQAYQQAIIPLQPQIEQSLAQGEYQQIRDLVAAARLPDGLTRQIRQAMAELPGPVAVRSSATAEDLPEASFAGQQETYLGVVGLDEVLAAVSKCWASLWTDRAITYRREQGFAHDEVALAVVVQAMVRADAAGVAFTADPVTGRTGVVTIESSWGLGESVVAGTVTPDSFTVARRITKRSLGDKHHRIDMLPAGATTLRETNHQDRSRFSLTEAQVRKVASLARRVDKHYGMPMDIEWALTDGRIWLLQARPVTARVEPPKRVGRIGQFIRTDIVEHFPEPYPLDQAVVELVVRCLHAAMLLAGIRLKNPRLVSMDPDGVAHIAHPEVSMWGIPKALLRLAMRRWTDPRDWQEREGQQARAVADRLQKLPVNTLSSPEIAGALAAGMAEMEALIASRFADYLSFHILRGLRLDALLRLTGTRLTQFDLLGNLDFATAVIDRRLRGLWASAPERVRCLLGESPIDVAAVRAADDSWWGEVTEFLAVHGTRASGGYQLFSCTTWRDDPGAFLAIVAMMAHDDREMSRESYEELRARLVAKLPRLLRRSFLHLVEDYRAGHVMREASVVEAEQVGAAVRNLAHEAGHRLAMANLLEAPAQVVYLTMSELLDWLRGGDVDVAAIVPQRIAARGKAQAVWQSHVRVASSGDGIAGVAASPGQARGTARIIGGPEDFGRLQPGDVLVCRATDPAWTPLFTYASAVIAETGGRLSHAAIVAREYGIPAVLGVPGATVDIPDRAKVTVDGSAGRVILSER